MAVLSSASWTCFIYHCLGRPRPHTGLACPQSQRHLQEVVDRDQRWVLRVVQQQQVSTIIQGVLTKLLLEPVSVSQWNKGEGQASGCGELAGGLGCVFVTVVSCCVVETQLCGRAVAATISSQAWLQAYRVLRGRRAVRHGMTS